MNDDRSYSTLMSVYGKEKPEFLRASIESVMNQTTPPNDFLIVCDGPLGTELDKVLEILSRKYSEIRLLRLEKNLGLGEALRLGLTQTKYEIVMRMDSDDICFSRRAEKQLALMNNFDLVGSWIEEFEGSENNIIGERRVPETFEKIYKFALRRCPFNHPSVMFRKSIILAAGSYKPLPYVEDYYLWIRVLNTTRRVTNVQEPLLKMRSGLVMRSRRGGKVYRKSLRWLRKYMLKEKMISYPKYLWIVLEQTIFLLVPLKLKEFIYRKALRN